MITRPAYNPPHQIEPIGDVWREVTLTDSSSFGASGSDKRMIIKTRFDGFGNCNVRFVVIDHGKEISYEKYDSAVDAYNRLK